MSTNSRLDVLLRRWEEHRRRGEDVPPEELCRDCPELLEPFRRGLAALRLFDRAVNQSVQANSVCPGPAVTTSYHDCMPDVELRPWAEPVPGFLLVHHLGSGAFGSVWRAEAPGGLPVAMKFVPRTGRIGDSERNALEVLRHVRHPNLLSVFGAWRSETHLIIAMELADRTLADRLQEAKAEGLAGIPAPELLEYLRAAAKGVDYLNQPHPLVEGREPVRVQHRDIKPANILLVGNGVKVADFGLVRVLERSIVSDAGGMTPAYAPPEFFAGRASRHSDQYSLAVTYCELRGGRLPFTGTCGEVILGHVQGTPDLGGLPEAERPVVARALAKDPDDRWSSCTMFAEALARVMPGVAPSQSRRRRPARLTLSILALVVGISWLWLSIQGSRERPGPPVPPTASGVSTFPDVANGPVDPDVEGPGVPDTTGDNETGDREVEVAPAPRRTQPGGTGAAVGVAGTVPAPRSVARVGERLRFTKHDGAGVRCTAWVPNTTRLLSGDSRGIIWMWDTTTGTEEARLDGHAGAVNCLSVSGDGRFAISGGEDGTVRLWDLRKGNGSTILRTRAGKKQFPVYGVGFSGEGRAVSAGNTDWMVVWDLGAGEEFDRLKTLPEVFCLVVSRDGRRVLTGGASGALRLRELTPGGRDEPYDGHRDDVLAVAFFPDGERFVSAGGGTGKKLGSEDYALRLWTVGDKTPRVLRGHAARVGCVAVAPDSRRVLSGDEDGTLFLWDVASGRPLPRFDGGGGAVWCAQFSPDGREAVSGHSDGSLRVWVLPDDPR